VLQSHVGLVCSTARRKLAVFLILISSKLQPPWYLRPAQPLSLVNEGDRIAWLIIKRQNNSPDHPGPTSPVDRNSNSPTISSPSPYGHLKRVSECSEGHPSWLPRRPPVPTPTSTVQSFASTLRHNPRPAKPVMVGPQPTPQSIWIISVADSQGWWVKRVSQSGHLRGWSRTTTAGMSLTALSMLIGRSVSVTPMLLPLLSDAHKSLNSRRKCNTLPSYQSPGIKSAYSKYFDNPPTPPVHGEDGLYRIQVIPPTKTRRHPCHSGADIVNCFRKSFGFEQINAHPPVGNIATMPFPPIPNDGGVHIIPVDTLLENTKNVSTPPVHHHLRDALFMERLSHALMVFGPCANVLKTCSVISKSWTSRSQTHIFSAISFKAIPTLWPGRTRFWIPPTPPHTSFERQS
jgi:hypothetical protein